MKTRIVAPILTIITLAASFNALGISLNKESPVYYYVNHEAQLLQLKQHLNESGIVGITGATAMGKSEMAKKYIEKYKDDYDILAVFDTSSNTTEQFINLIRKINSTICIE